jgi:hypothetical protein
MTDLNYAPIPKWNNIVKALLVKKKTKQIYNKNWLLKNEKGYWFSRTAWSIYLIIKFRLLVNRDEQVNLWLPDYFCNESLVAIRSLGVKLSFYPILFDGRPNLLVCNKMHDDLLPDVILYVNYFGEPLFSKGLSDIALKANAWLIEDSAHCLKPDNGIGKNGDFVIYSPHKLLAIPDGGLLVIRPNGPSKISNELLDKFSFDQLYNSVINSKKTSHFFSIEWLFKRVIQKFGLHVFRQKNNFKNNNYSLDIHSLPPPEISWLARKLLSNILDLESESKHRKNIHYEWQESLKKNKKFERENIEIIKLRYVPYMAKITSRSSKTSENIFDLFQNSNIPVSSWPDLAPEVLQNPDAHKIAIEMSVTCVFLPVHCSINKKILTEKIRSI